MAEPYCLAMILCDGVHVDPGTGKFTILGTFTNFSATSFPAAIQFVVYFAVTDGLGDVTLTLQLVDATADPIDATNEENDPARVFIFKQQAHFPDPLTMIEGVFGVQVILPKAGLYHCELWANSDVLMSRRLSATEIPTS